MNSYKRVPSRIRQTESRRKKKIYTLLIFIVLIIIGGLLWVFNYRGSQIVRVSVEGAISVNSQTIQETTENILLEKYFYIIPKSNFPFLPRDQIKKTIGALSPKIETVILDQKGAHTLRVLVQERKPAFTWCNIKEVCFYVDETGYSYEKIEEGGNEKPLFVFSSFMAPDCETFCKIVGVDSLRPIFFSKDVLSSKGISIKQVDIDANNDYTLTLDTGTRIQFTGEHNIEEALNNLFSLVQSQIFKEQEISFEDGLDRIEYIDLRFGKKLFYSLK